jgi:hypothetical protein
MNKLALLVLTLLVVAATASASPLCTSLTTLQDYITNGACDLTSGATFSNFTWQGLVPNSEPGGISNGVPYAIPASNVVVSVYDFGGAIGLDFSSALFGGIQATPTRAGTLTANLFFRLTLPTDIIYGASAAVKGLTRTGTSSMSLDSTNTDFFDPGNIATLAINHNSNPTTASDIFIPAARIVDIQEQIHLIALRGTNDVVGFSSFEDRFSIPEPMTALLMGSGLMALGLAGRRIRSSK